MTRRILLAEDDVANADLIRLILKNENYVVFIARTGQEALDLLSSQQVDLVLMDVKMPVLDGIEATKRLRSKSETAHLPIIFVTGMVTPETDAKMKAVDPIAIITKPFELRTLMQTIDQALSTQTFGNHLDNSLRLSLIQEPGSVSSQEQELLTGVAVGPGDVSNQFGAGQGRQARVGVSTLLKAHQARLRDPDKLGSRTLAQLLGFSQPVDQVPEPFS